MNQTSLKFKRKELSPKQKCQLPTLDYTARKKEKLKTFFRESRVAVSNSPRKHEVKTQREIFSKLDYENSTNLYGLEISQSLQQETKKFKVRKNSIKKENNQSDTPLNWGEQESELSSSDSNDEEKQQQQLELTVEGETGKALRSISHKLNHELNNSFYHFLKKQDKIKDLISKFQQKEIVNPIHYYCMNESIFPKRIEIAQKVDVGELNLADLGLTPKYIPLIRNLLNQKKDKNIKLIDISSNKINEWSLKLLIDVFPNVVRNINISNNELSRRGAILLASQIHKFQNLRALNLKRNQMGDIGTGMLLNSLKQNQRIKKLNLSENYITDAISEELQNLIKNNNNLEVLSLNWNQLGALSGGLLARALIAYYSSIKVLDLSYNKIGQGDKNNEYLLDLCKALSSQSSLIHLDLSYNQFTEKQLQQIYFSIVKNTNIYGLHVEGNKCQAYVDPLGFIQFPKQSKQMIQQKHQDIDGVNYLPIDQIGSDSCWICEGWMEYHFVYEPDPDELDLGVVYLHLDFLKYHQYLNSFQPISMTTSKELWRQINSKFKQKNFSDNLTTGEIMHQLRYAFDTEKNITMTAIDDAYQQIDVKDDKFESILSELNQRFYYTSYQMCPPNKQVIYFYSNPTGKGIFINERFPKIQIDQNLLLPGSRTFSYPDGSQLTMDGLESVNYFKTKQMFVIDQKNQYKPLIKVIPRQLGNQYFIKRFAADASKKQQNLIFWQKDQSAFKSHFGDQDDILEDCFEFDWSCLRIIHFFKVEQEIEKIKQLMKEQYSLFKAVYKYYSSFGYQKGAQNSTFNIPFELIHEMDNEIPYDEIQSQINQIKYNSDPKYIYNPEKGLVRYQFLEYLFRWSLVQAKLKSKPKAIVDEVFRTFAFLKEKYKFLDLQQWREERLWTKECGNLIFIKQGFIQRVYDFVASINNKKWSFRLKWIAVAEFVEFCKIMHFNQYLSETQMKIIYNFSMQPHIDELNQDRHLRMSLVEFTEALARISEFISPSNFDTSKQERQLLPLHIKLESLLTHIFIMLKSLKVNEITQFSHQFSYVMEWILPEKDTLQPDQYQSTDQKLTIYNTNSYLINFKQTYLHPNYIQFLLIPYQLEEEFFSQAKKQRAIVRRQMTQKQKILQLQASLLQF